MENRFGKKIALAAVILLAAVACSGKNQAATAQKVAQMANNPAQCPKIQAGHYNMDNSKSVTYIEVLDDTAHKQLVLNFNGIEVVAVNGNKEAQKNGSNYTGACVDNGITVVGTDAKQTFTQFRILAADDGGLQLNESKPSSFSAHYTRAGVATSTLDQLLNTTTTNATQTQGSGIPNPDSFAPKQ